jgi:hypothetical protein
MGSLVLLFPGALVLSFPRSLVPLGPRFPVACSLFSRSIAPLFSCSSFPCSLGPSVPRSLDPCCQFRNLKSRQCRFPWPIRRSRSQLARVAPQSMTHLRRCVSGTWSASTHQLSQSSGRSASHRPPEFGSRAGFLCCSHLAPGPSISAIVCSMRVQLFAPAQPTHCVTATSFTGAIAVFSLPSPASRQRLPPPSSSLSCRS